MIRGTTAQFRFKLPYTKGELGWATIKFWQPNNNGTITAPLPITKRLADCSGADDEKELCVTLTAEETTRFSDRFKAKVQLRAQRSKDGVVFASEEESITVYPINDDILTDDPTMPSENEEGWIILDGGTIM